MKTVISIAAALVWLALSCGAAAQSWPQKPVHFILSLGPGSGADIGARLYADRLTKMWGHPVVVENRPGGDGVIAINAVIQAKDDHTLLWGPTANFVGHLFSRSSTRIVMNGDVSSLTGKRFRRSCSNSRTCSCYQGQLAGEII